ncbi:MAG TPA: hypothetical protein VLA34_08630, partial [Candidatus Krumholzibacterium sp.]|nr:hypothetical protein [Candidatus Krumholzibacterium sp.]
VLSSLASIDNVCFTGDVSGEDSCLVQKVHMAFDLPEESTGSPAGTDGTRPRYASLRVRAKNTFWLDYTYKELFVRFGSAYPVWFEQKRHESASKLTGWSLKQEIPLSVHIKKGGQWEFADYFNIAGPIAMKDDVLRVDLSGVDTDRVEIMLSFGFLFWEIDYVTVDFTGETCRDVTCLKPSRAVDARRGDISALIAEDDSIYYDQPDIGDEALLAFGAIPASGGRRSFFLHSKGHYEIIVDTDGTPDIGFISGFTEPLRFTAFSRELFLGSFHSSVADDPIRPAGTTGSSHPAEMNESR